MEDYTFATKVIFRLAQVIGNRSRFFWKDGWNFTTPSNHT